MVFGIRTPHSLEWFYVLQDVYQLPTHKNLSSIPLPRDTSKMSFTCKSLNMQGQGIDTCGKKLLPYTNLPLLIRNWTVQTWPALAAFIKGVLPPSDSCSCLINTDLLDIYFLMNNYSFSWKSKGRELNKFQNLNIINNMLWSKIKEYIL